MRHSRIALFSGTAAMLLMGIAGVARAQGQDVHVMTLRLPDGRIEQIRYTGAVPPTVVVAPGAGFEAASPFAMLAQMQADMVRQEAAMLRAVNAMGGPGFGMMPAMAGPGVCSRRIQITFTGNGQAPHVVSQTSGDCGGASRQPTPAALPNAPVAHPAPHVIEARAGDAFPG